MYKVGESVRLVSSGTFGTITSLPQDEFGDYWVKVNDVQFAARIDNLSRHPLAKAGDTVFVTEGRWKGWTGTVRRYECYGRHSVSFPNHDGETLHDSCFEVKAPGGSMYKVGDKVRFVGTEPVGQIISGDGSDYWVEYGDTQVCVHCDKLTRYPPFAVGDRVIGNQGNLLGCAGTITGSHPAFGYFVEFDNGTTIYLHDSLFAAAPVLDDHYKTKQRESMSAFTIGDTVEVTDGPHKGKRGKVVEATKTPMGTWSGGLGALALLGGMLVPVAIFAWARSPGPSVPPTITQYAIPRPLAIVHNVECGWDNIRVVYLGPTKEKRLVNLKPYRYRTFFDLPPGAPAGIRWKKRSDRSYPHDVEIHKASDSPDLYQGNSY